MFTGDRKTSPMFTVLGLLLEIKVARDVLQQDRTVASGGTML